MGQHPPVQQKQWSIAMAKRYTHLAPDERYYINARLEAGDSQSEIARSLGRSPSTVSRELKRNTGLRGYRPKQAQRLGDYRHAARRRGAAPVLPQVHAPRRNHRRAGPARRLQDQQPAAQVPRLQYPRRGLAKRLRFWRNHRFTERCTSRLNVGFILDSQTHGQH